MPSAKRGIAEAAAVAAVDDDSSVDVARRQKPRLNETNSDDIKEGQKLELEDSCSMHVFPSWLVFFLKKDLLMVVSKRHSNTKQ